MIMYLRWYDTVLKDIDQYILCHQPERGGALLGPRGQAVVSHFVPDPQAATTTVSYVPSAALGVAVRQLETQEAVEYKGIIHSHPSSLAQPSGPDLVEFGEQLRVNPHLGWFIAPIAVHGPGNPQAAHEIIRDQGRIAVYAARRPHPHEPGPVGLRRLRSGIIPSVFLVRALSQTLCGTVVGPRDTQRSAEHAQAWHIALRDGRQVLVLIGPEVPDHAGPQVVLLESSHEHRHLDLPWPSTVSDRVRLRMWLVAAAHAINQHPTRRSTLAVRQPPIPAPARRVLKAYQAASIPATTQRSPGWPYRTARRK
ncbi:MAG: hypothetical protein EA401_01260 [Planctomycetota bacterium]|nr:MAG: hypothetical protein EA401_01260 [Planctomycetota bacterium]